MKLNNKKKHPLLNSLVGFILLIIFVGMFDTIATKVNEILFDGNIQAIMDEIEYYAIHIIGFGGAAVILFDSFTGKQIIKNILKKIWNFYRNFKVYWIYHVLIILVLLGLIICYQNNSSKLCGKDGSIYYCETSEDIECDGDLVPVFDKKSYKCVSNDIFRHDYEHVEYDYICTKKYNSGIIEQDEKLIEAERGCLYNKVIDEATSVITDIKNDLPSTYDVRDKVTIKAGDQGGSNTCYLWSVTKALEISAQLKGIDYQFLLDFEKQINNTKTFNPLDEGTSDALCFNDECYSIPGKQKSINVVDLSQPFYNDDSQDNKYYPEFSDEFKKYYNEYLNLYNSHNILSDSNFMVNTDEYFNIMTKFIIMKYGSSFILNSDENKYINPIVGHQMTIIGWDDSKQAWLVLNSWGNSWNNGGLKSNGDGTTWVKYSDKGWNVGAGATELISK